MSKVTAYCFGLRKVVEIVDPKIVILKNGRKAVTGRAKDAPQYRVFRTIAEAQARELADTLEG